MREQKTVRATVYRWLVASALCVCAAWTAGQEVPEFTTADLGGPPSNVKIHRARKRAKRLGDAYRKSRQEWSARRASLAAQHRKRLAQVVPKVQAKKSYQDYIVTFRRPDNQPASDLHLTAMVRLKSGATKTIPLTTKNDGQAILPKIGPLPATVELALAPESKDWEFKSPEQTSLLIPDHLGPKVSEGDAPSRAGLRLAAYAPRAGGVVVYRFKQPDPILVERQFVDVEITGAPAGVEATTPVPEVKVEPQGADIRIQLPVSALKDGEGLKPLPIRVAAHLKGGDAETVIENYRPNPYNPSRIEWSSLKLNLVTLKNINLHGADPLSSDADIARALGALGTPSKRLDAEGVEKWSYSQGMDVFMRRSPNNRKFVDYITLTGPDGGDIGGVRVGDGMTAAREAFGDPQRSEGSAHYYADGGMMIFASGDRIETITLFRPRALLEKGTTAFVPRQKARLYVKDFKGDPQTGMAAPEDLKDYMRQFPGVSVVEKPEEADLILDVSDFRVRSAPGPVYGDLSLRLECKAELNYALTDATGEAGASKPGLAVGQADIDFTRDKPGLTDALDTDRTLAVSFNRTRAVSRVFPGDPANLWKFEVNVRRAEERAPCVCARKAFAQMTQDIARQADFTVCVTGTDDRGILTLNAGKEEGLQVGNEFEILQEGNPAFPVGKSDNSMDYYTAVVTQINDNDTCECQLKHYILNTGSDGLEQVQDAPAPEMVQRLPGAVSGVLSARAWLPYPELKTPAVANGVPGGENGTEFERYVYGEGRPLQIFHDNVVLFVIHRFGVSKDRAEERLRDLDRQPLFIAPGFERTAPGIRRFGYYPPAPERAPRSTRATETPSTNSGKNPTHGGTPTTTGAPNKPGTPVTPKTPTTPVKPRTPTTPKTPITPTKPGTPPVKPSPPKPKSSPPPPKSAPPPKTGN